MNRACLVTLLCTAACNHPGGTRDPLPAMHPELRIDLLSATSKVPCGDHEDDHVDGTTDFRDAYRYDAAGREVADDFATPDGTVLSTTSTSYDAMGHRIEVHVHDLTDASFDTWNSDRFDPFGRNVSSRYRQRTFVIDRTNEFNASGEKTVAHVDTNGDGSIDANVTYTYDELGREIENLKDDHVDGTIDRVTTIGYDDDHGVITVSQTFAGYTPNRWTITYSADGRILTNHWVYGTHDPDIGEGLLTYDYSCP